MKVVMSGGGTAGHVHPALSVAALLAADGDSVAFVGTPQGIEARLAREAGVPFHALAASGFDRSRPWTLVSASLRILRSVGSAWRFLGGFRPDVVLGFGGYVSLPVAVAAILRGTALVIHEQNSVPGMANRFLSRWAKAVAATYPGSERYFAHPERVVVTGNPVREAVLAAERERGREAFGIPDGSVMLLAFGGSRGARHLNTALTAAMERILGVPGVEVVHIAGPSEVDATAEALGDFGGARERWRVLGYVDDMPNALAAADVVVARAGATSIAEITARGIAAVLVPYPYATDDHQTANAAAASDAGGALVVPDAELDTPGFADAVVGLLSNAQARATMSAASRSVGRPDATARVADVARQVLVGTIPDREEHRA